LTSRLLELQVTHQRLSNNLETMQVHPSTPFFSTAAMCMSAMTTDVLI